MTDIARGETRRYTAVAIALHWAIALLIIGQIVGGFVMSSAEDAALRDLSVAQVGAESASDAAQRAGFEATIADAQARLAAIFDWFQLHKSFGLLVLFLSLARLGWRFLNPAPPLPGGMNAFERVAAHTTHWAFYAIMIAGPVSGWLLASASVSGKSTEVFFLLPWPHFPIAASAETEHLLLEVHEILAFGAVALLGLHVAAALKHHFVNKDGLMARMIPGLFGATRGPVRAARGAVIVFPVVAALFAAIAFLAASPGPAVADGTRTATVSGDWVVDLEQSQIGFSGANSGQPFDGVFASWNADITFDPAAPEAASATVTIATASATTGSRGNDRSLAEAAWLDPNGHPEAVFTSTAVRALGDDAYEMDGDLTLKGVTQPVTLAFTLVFDGDVARATGSADVDRIAFDVGASADRTGAWVSRTIAVTIDVTATRAE